MKISRDSWHYRYYMFCNERAPKTHYGTVTLCRYVQTMFWMTLAFLIMGATVLLFSPVIITVLGLFAFVEVTAGDLFYRDMEDPYSLKRRYEPFNVRGWLFYPIHVIICCMFIGGQLGVIFKLGFGIVMLTASAFMVLVLFLVTENSAVSFLLPHRAKREVIDEHQSPLTFTKVVGEFLEAKKQKVCPFIEFTDE